MILKFSGRVDRYNHELSGDETEDTVLLGGFSSCSPQYRKVQYKLSLTLPTTTLEGIVQKNVAKKIMFNHFDHDGSHHAGKEFSNIV